MDHWKKLITYVVVLHSMVIASESFDSISLDRIHRNISDFSSLNTFYRNLLQDVRHHRPIDTVISPINVTRIRLNDYDKSYLRNSCYESMSDILYAHGFNRSEAQLSKEDLQSLLPAILSAVDNPGCARQSPPAKIYSIRNILLIGFSLIFLIKMVHLITFSVVADHCLSLTSVGLTELFSKAADPNRKTPSLPLKSRLWLGLGFNAFTCGLMLGTVVYHLIPNIYDIPNENFDYIYLLRATVIFFGIYLFFLVEKLLRFRFNIDEFHFDDPNSQGDDELEQETDPTMIQMAKMCGTMHINNDINDHGRLRTSSIVQMPLQQVDSDDEDTDEVKFKNGTTVPSRDEHQRLPVSKPNLILYHIINDFSTDLIYGCSLCTGLAHDRLIGFVLSLMIFSEGFRRHSQTTSQLGRRRALLLVFFSFLFLSIGFGICIYLLDFNRNHQFHLIYVQYDYVYSIIYGALFYTALVTLIPELNDFGHHLQMSLGQINQTSKQRQLIKTFILICQNLFLIIGVMIALILAWIWRYYHRIHIFDYVCNRDYFRLLCYRH